MYIFIFINYLYNTHSLMYMYIYMYIYIYTHCGNTRNKEASSDRSPAFLPEQSTSLPIRSRHRKLTSASESTPRPHIASCNTTWSTCKRGPINQSINGENCWSLSSKVSNGKAHSIMQLHLGANNQATKHTCMWSEHKPNINKQTHTTTQPQSINKIQVCLLHACRHMMVYHSVALSIKPGAWHE
jgi:hypothetical protein